MKKLFALSLLLLFYFISCSPRPEWEGVFDYYPEKPEPGEEITVFYNSDSTKLASQDKIDLIVYFYDVDLIDAVGVEMKKINNGWEGKIKTTADARGLIIKFKNEDLIDNNNKSGYVIHLYKSDKILPGSIAGLGEAVLTWGAYYADLERDFELALKYLEDDFTASPEIKNEYLNSYFLTYSRLHPESANEVISKELSELEKQEKLSEKNLEVLINWYEETGSPEKSEHYKSQLFEKYPLSKAAQLARYREIQKEPDIEKKNQLVNKFAGDFPDSKYLNSAYDLIAIYYRDNNLYKNALEFFKNNGNKTTVYRFYSVTQKMYKENADPQTTLEIAKLGVQRAESEITDPSGKKPEYFTEKEWEDDIKLYAGLNYFSYGKALYLTGNTEDAEANLEKAADLTKKQDEEINEMYVTVVNANGDKSKTKKIIERFIKEGKSTSAMMDILKDVYIAENGTEKGFDNYISQFKSVALKELEEKLKTEMISKPAPDFILEDLNGDKVSMNDLKGKTVIIDFWATWCGPCLQSFPGMKKAVEKYSDNENVKFLFVNSWERVDEKKKNAQDFLKENNYPFHVLMDYDNKVISDFGVAGIPTKFMVDKNGNIRFMSVGFMGNTDHLVDEISVMIELLE